MPASEATNYSTDELQVVDITDSTNLDAQQSALLDETKKAKKIPPKGVSMSEVIRLHQVRANRFLSYLGCKQPHQPLIVVVFSCCYLG